jgi:antitoxin (DNA-binding transcriptional repressor) of toxin-antitoxin stability system
VSIAAKDVVPFTQARANLPEPAEEVKQGSEKVITKSGESYAALLDSDRLDYYHRLERERIHLLLSRGHRIPCPMWRLLLRDHEAPYARAQRPMDHAAAAKEPVLVVL